jgi:hypothetical protein
MKRAILGTLILLSAAQVGLAQEAVPTRVMVRVLARDAKIIGSGVGGAQVRIVVAVSGELLAEGKLEGGTGDTGLIMSTAHARDMTIYATEGTAGFLAELKLSEPTIVNISAVGPLMYPQAIQSATKQMLLVPGQHVEGDGVILELHGYIVEILSPEPLTPVGDAFDVSVRVRMMCGCPIEPGGLWDAAAMEFTAHLKANGAHVARSSLQYAGERNMFKGTVSVPASARGKDLEIEVVVSDPGRQNFGKHAVPLGQASGG